jgi:hypothetical protein
MNEEELGRLEDMADEMRDRLKALRRDQAKPGISDDEIKALREYYPHPAYPPDLTVEHHATIHRLLDEIERLRAQQESARIADQLYDP